MALTEEQRKDLYEKLLAEKKGMSGEEMGQAVGGIAQGVMDIAQAGTGAKTDLRTPIQQMGRASDRREQSNQDRWRELLKMDRAGGQTADTKRYNFMKTDEGLVRVNRVTGDQELVREAAPEPEKAPKQSATQLKKAGQADVGRRAEEQYQEAVGKGDYDPTSFLDPANYRDLIPDTLQPLLTSDSAKAATAAMDSWTETYLRDASGAAIPPSERESYYKIYFPMKGDTPEVIENKRALREQKEAAIRREAGQSPELVPQGESPAPDNIPQADKSAPVKQVRYKGKLYNVDAEGVMTEVK